MTTSLIPRLRIPALLAALGVPALVLGAQAPGSVALAAGQRACAAWKVVPSPSRGASTLSAVASTSAQDGWAVGSYDAGGAYLTLIEHWNGRSWRVVPSPNPAWGFHTTNALGGVVAISAKNAWAFGFYERKTTSFRTLIEHWNGIKWSVVPSPNSGTGENTLGAAAVRSASAIWAVGYRQDGTGPRRTLVEHWNGSKWTIVSSPNVGSGENFLFGVAVVSPHEAWAVGSDSVSFGRTLAMRWNGHAWSVVKTVNQGQGDRFLQAVAAPSAGHALAVGSDVSGNQTRALAERWAGSMWSLAAAASPGGVYNSLQAIAATSTRSAWAVGARQTSQGSAFRTLAEHWNGTSWAAAASPSPGRADDWLFGIAAVPKGGGFWAVGNAGASTLTEFHC